MDNLGHQQIDGGTNRGNAFEESWSQIVVLNGQALPHGGGLPFLKRRQNQVGELSGAVFNVAPDSFWYPALDAVNHMKNPTGISGYQPAPACVNAESICSLHGW
ncbi:hypothetical protein [Arthrobacter sp. YN]|uniref:hypothetical protein n=1 Tax=Arthrobacter sp. YN TaxID=2020486 RepID=UPI001E3F8233|nr:hypothetical protein [Arthrobacter sp. YN]